MSQKVWVVVPHHSRFDLLEKSLASVADHSVIVVDDSVSGLKHSLPEVVVLRTSGETGFAKSCNVGLGRAESEGAEWVLLLNDDAILEEGALEALLEAAKAHQHADAFGPVLVGPTGIESAGLCFSPRTARVVQRTDVPDAPREVMALSGACLLVRSFWRFSEEFPHAMEDIDLGLRIREVGKKSLLVPGARCWHLGGGTRSRKDPRATRDALRGHLRLVGPRRDKRFLVVIYAVAQVLREGPRLRRLGAVWQGWRMG